MTTITEPFIHSVFSPFFPSCPFLSIPSVHRRVIAPTADLTPQTPHSQASVSCDTKRLDLNKLELPSKTKNISPEIPNLRSSSFSVIFFLRGWFGRPVFPKLEPRLSFPLGENFTTEPKTSYFLLESENSEDFSRFIHSLFWNWEFTCLCAKTSTRLVRS